jgi:5-hydroxyisourate hydrolase-like protein (transthyretin family)
MSTAEASLSGTVTDSSTGDPISGASVAIFNDSTNQKLTATTDSSGAYSIESFPAGTYDIEVEAGDYNPGIASERSLQAGNTEIDFELKKINANATVPGESGGPSDTGVTSGGVVII